MSKTVQKQAEIKISPNFNKGDWQKLDLNSKNEVDWNKAFEIFEDRIKGRYLEQIEVLDLNPNRKIGTYAGFSIMSITCLLIETLEQFWNGNIETSRNNSSNEVISNDAIAFYNFFQRSENFKAFFNTPEKANVFYVKIRCGLLHQGQTKGKSLIHIRSSEPMLAWINTHQIEDGLSINRRKFVDEIKVIFNKYLLFLEESNLNERKKIFKRKMDYIINT